VTYNSKTHIIHTDLAAHMGTTGMRLTHLMKRIGGPTIAGSLDLPRDHTSNFYYRDAALAWAAEVDQPKAEYRGKIVPAAEIRPLHEQGTYRPSPQMRINQDRAAEVYPHRLITPDGVGNGPECAQGNRRFST